MESWNHKGLGFKVDRVLDFLTFTKSGTVKPAGQETQFENFPVFCYCCKKWTLTLRVQGPK